jgi:aminopeptidase N
MPAEKDYTLLGDVTGKLRMAKAYLDEMGPEVSAYRNKVLPQLEQMAYKASVAAQGDNNFQRRWFGTYLGLASTPAALAQLADILSGKQVVPGLNVGQDLRWGL